MAKLQWNDKEKLELLASLEALLGCVKSLHATVGAVMADIAAIRNSLFDDPEDMAVYRASLRLAVTTAKPMVDELNSCEDLLQDIVNSQRYKN